MRVLKKQKLFLVVSFVLLSLISFGCNKQGDPPTATQQSADTKNGAETGLVLETAVGIPYRLYIPLNDRQGGKRIAMGYGFSYYEWSQPMSNRLDNEQWKRIVYGNTDMKKYLPFWMRENVAPPK